MVTEAYEFMNSRVIMGVLVQLRIFTFFLMFLRLFTQILVNNMQISESRKPYLVLKTIKKYNF